MFGDDAKPGARGEKEAFQPRRNFWSRSLPKTQMDQIRRWNGYGKGQRKKKKKGFCSPQWNKIMFQIGNKNGCCCWREETCNLDIGNARMRWAISGRDDKEDVIAASRQNEPPFIWRDLKPRNRGNGARFAEIPRVMKSRLLCRQKIPRYASRKLLLRKIVVFSSMLSFRDIISVSSFSRESLASCVALALASKHPVVWGAMGPYGFAVINSWPEFHVPNTAYSIYERASFLQCVPFHLSGSKWSLKFAPKSNNPFEFRGTSPRRRSRFDPANSQAVLGFQHTIARNYAWHHLPLAESRRRSPMSILLPIFTKPMTSSKSWKKKRRKTRFNSIALGKNTSNPIFAS